MEISYAVVNQMWARAVVQNNGTRWETRNKVPRMTPTSTGLLPRIDTSTKKGRLLRILLDRRRWD